MTLLKFSDSFNTTFDHTAKYVYRHESELKDMGWHFSIPYIIFNAQSIKNHLVTWKAI